MLGTRIVATTGVILAVASIVLGPQFWGYQTGVLMLQVGVLALGLGMFWRLNLRPRIEEVLLLDDVEAWS